MTSRVIQTLIEPSVVTIPLLRTDIPPSSRVATTVKSLASTTVASATVTMTATDSSASLPTSITIPPLPSNFDSPLATGRDATPTIAILTLIAVIIFALILLSALSYFIFLRFRGKCPKCPRYEDELNKWKNGDLKQIKAEMIQERMRVWDLEKGGMDLQAQMYKDRMRKQSLACLEGTLDGRTLEGRTDSLWSGGSVIHENEKEEVDEYFQVDAKLQGPVPAHLAAAAALVGGDADATLVNPEFPKTHSAYLRDIVAPREAEAKRLLQEGEEQAINRHLNIASDPTQRESVQQRAMIKAKEMITEREGKKGESKKQQMPALRKGSESRFKERFSLETNHDL